MTAAPLPATWLNPTAPPPLDPHIVEFMRLMAAEGGRYPKRHTIPIAAGRANAEKVRAPWTEGGPTRARTVEQQVPTRHGNVRMSTIDAEFVVSGDYQQIRQTAVMLKDLVGEGATMQRGEKQQPVRDFPEAMRWLLAEVQRSMTLQRYKGLGEMNPEQLWETTMDVSARRLLRVQIEDGIAADEIFTKLMGDEVEPRRAFIELNALGVRNLDV